MFQAGTRCGGRSRALAWNDVKHWRIECPPRLRHFAIGDESLVQHVTVFDPVGPERFEIEGIGGGQDARTGHDFCRRGAADGVELPFLGFRVVLAMIGVQNVAGYEMFQADVRRARRPNSCPN